MADDFSNDAAGRSELVLDEANQMLHGCFTHDTATNGGMYGENVNANHRSLGGAWQNMADAVGGNTSSGAQEHCSMAVRSNGARVMAYHDGNNVKVRFETTTPGVEDFTITFTGGQGVDLNWPTLAIRTVGLTEMVHLAVVNTTTNTIVYRACDVASVAGCNTTSTPNWSTTRTVENGNSGIPTHPQIAVDENGIVYALYADEIAGQNNDRVRVSCGTGSANFSSLDGGIVDGSADDEGLATKNGVSPLNRGHAIPQIVVSDVLDAVKVVYVQDADTSAAVDFVGRSSVHATGCP